MKRYLILVLCALTCFLCACGDVQEYPEYSGVTNTYELMISDTDWLRISVPVELSLTLTDGYSHMEFSDGTIFDVSNTQATTAKYDEYSGLYIGDNSLQLNVYDKCVIVSCVEPAKSFFTETLNASEYVTLTTARYEEKRIKELPDYTEVNMELINNMYMPVGTMDRDWLGLEAQLYTSGTSYVQLRIYDFPLADIENKLLTQLLCNTGKTELDEWYMGNDILYMRAGDHCIVTKKLAYNSTYVYSCTIDMLSYALQGVHKVRGTVGE